MTLKAADVEQGLKLTQLAQMIVSLGYAIKSAIESGRDSVTPDELRQAFDNKNEALDELSQAIAQAKAAGRE